jgi:glycosyltransferase involved in cell wall biosynthesis
VVGEAARLFDPRSTDELQNAIVDLWESDSRRREFSARGREQARKFSWKACAESVASAYGEAA